MMQAGVCLRRDTETTLPELTEQHRIRQKEEELSGLESVHMPESDTECAAPGLNTLEPECVTAHSGSGLFLALIRGDWAGFWTEEETTLIVNTGPQQG
ncbi:hypothetical protein SKAU_G00115740 [Synaphobranchus kaupii]|uniref:Uncharacterized protein n=1 Tax=Synaphobranchus kaupii TaxID=118154 RepID=A0A9Q1FMR1_SYNKA|nr:hypothetical protein SKAU_G00115740 [Synaphobranchus kaupii]